jgi:hypothetical protein
MIGSSYSLRRKAMFCTYCGAQNPDTDAFCQQCGKQFDRRPGQETHSSSPPTPPTGTAIKQKKNRGYIIAVAGAVVALIAYHALPFVSYNTQFEPTTGILYNPVAVTAEGFDSSTQFSALLTLITLILLALLIFRSNPFGMKNTSSILQRRRAIYAMIGMSVLSILIYVREVISNNNSAIPFDRIDAGFWIYLLCLVTIIVGSIIALSSLSSSLQPQAHQEGEPPLTQLPPQSTIHR